MCHIVCRYNHLFFCIVIHIYSFIYSYMNTLGAAPRGKVEIYDFLFRYISHRTLMPRRLLIWDLDSSLMGDASLPTEGLRFPVRVLVLRVCRIVWESSYIFFWALMCLGFPFMSLSKYTCAIGQYQPQNFDASFVFIWDLYWSLIGCIIAH